MREQSILVTIITVTYNSAATIEDTLISVLEQTYSNIDYVIIDGGSIDRTLEIISSYTSDFKEKGITIKTISEKDKGIADAWNKGLRIAKGGIIGLLNSDDWYARDSVHIATKILDPRKKELSYGICKRVDEHKKVIAVLPASFSKSRVYLNFRFSHTTCFVTKKTYEEIGCFDTNYRIAMDVDFLLRSLKRGVVFKKAKNITFMRAGGVSAKQRKKATREYQLALRKNGYNVVIIFIFGMLKKLIALRN